jgi:hypothetical protein
VSVALRAGLVAACDDPQLLDMPLWPRQREILGAVEQTRLSVLALGRRSGKTTMAALVSLWCCLLRPELLTRLRPGERGYAVTIATNHRQSRLVVQAALSIVERSPLLAPLIEGVTEDAIDFANGTTLAAFPCGSRGARGWPILSLTFDELAHMVDAEGSNLAADAVVQALLPATAQFGDDARVIASSTPWGADGCFAEMFAKADSGEMPGSVAHTATTAEMNPTIEPAFLEAEERRDPEGFKSEYLAQFVGSGGAFFDPENVAACVTLPGQLRPEDGEDWVAGLDPAFSSDPFGLVLVGRDKRDRRRLLVGLVRSWVPPRLKPASLDEARVVEDAVLAEVASVLRLFDARAITDQYKSAGVAERLRRYGIRVRTEAMTAPVKDAAFGFLRGRINEGSVELPEHPELTRELRAIRTRYAAGRSSVVLPRIGGSHCDLAQALAIAVFEHDRNSLGGDEVTISVPSGRVRPRRFLTEEPLPFSDAVAVGGMAQERLAAMRARSGGTTTTRLRPELRE